MLNHYTDILLQKEDQLSARPEKSNPSEIGMAGTLKTLFLLDALLSESKSTSADVI